MLSEDIIQKVKEFYNNNENNRIMTGRKERVSISKNQYAQKRLLLCTLRELCGEYKQQNADIKLGFSKFCTLCPKWCDSAGASGTHNVCVCTMHQNTILLLHAAHIEETYKELIALAVCDMENKECMLQRYLNCPGFRLVETMLQENFEDLNEEIYFKQWVSVDRTHLISQSFDYVHQACNFKTNSISLTSFYFKITHHLP